MKAVFGSDVNKNRVLLQDVIPLDTPFSVIIDTCSVCNFKCRFCGPQTSALTDKRKKTVMSYELFKKIVDDINMFPDKIKKMSLGVHGEPLINKDLFRMIKYAKGFGIPNINFATNGSLLTKDAADALADSEVDEVKISVEALDPESYYDICKYKIDYNKFLENIKYFYEHRNKTRLVIKIIDEMIKNDEDRSKFFDMFGDICDRIDIENVIPMWTNFDDIYDKFDFSDKKGINQQNVVHTRVCPTVFYTAVILSDGRVVPCCVDWLGEMELGNVNTESLSDIWNGERRKAFLVDTLRCNYEKYPDCRKCGWKTYSCNDNIDDSADDILKKLIKNG